MTSSFFVSYIWDKSYKGRMKMSKNINVTQFLDKPTALSITEAVHDLLIDMGHGLTAFEWELNVTIPVSEEKDAEAE